jgi:hypothetical protein
VKEAVRMSRSMKAVEVPQEVLDDIGQKEAEAAERALQMRQEAAIQARPTVKAEPIIDDLARPPTELPEKPVVVTRPEPRPEPRPVARPEPRPEPRPPVPPPVEHKPEKRGTSGILIALLVIAVIGGGGYLAYEYWWKKRNQDDAGEVTKKTVKEPGKATATATTKGPAPATGTATAPATGTATAPATGTEPGTATATATGTEPGTATATATGTEPGTAPATGTEPGTGTAPEVAPKPEATLEASAPTGGGTVVEIKAQFNGTATTAVAKGADVKAGDKLIELKGGQKKIDGLVYDIEKGDPATIAKAKKALDAATRKGDKAGAKKAQDKIDERTRRIEEKKAELDALRNGIVAPQDGKVVKIIRAGGRINKGDVVAAIEGTEGGSVTLNATFGVPADKTYETGSAVQISSKDGAQQATCSVTKVEGTKVTVSCSEGAGVGAGTTVVLD